MNNRAYAFFGKPLDFNDLMDTLGRIAKESSDQSKQKMEHSRLVMEYAKLKQAYDDMKALIRENE